ncbi:BlaI/MecI/CopY family transcriptional regulator [Intestinibacillus massiliensis]|uniref:BlaI/MecI/CopY family transcriptional regulator n=1 Tax=Intestinibacillus massiliensis TaxID=1871029 RepID=UPI000B35D92A|nr:BlaI/MecI/CopY family transcriptional regulator [Intestinibacillus massiliensis]
MDKSEKRISDTELEILNLLWHSDEALSSTEVFERLDTGWKYPTVTTLLGRLVEKGAVRYEKRGKAYYYSPAIDEAAYKASETARFISRMHGGSVRSMIAALCDSRGLTEQDAEALRRIFDLTD